MIKMLLLLTASKSIKDSIKKWVDFLKKSLKKTIPVLVANSTYLVYMLYNFLVDLKFIRNDKTKKRRFKKCGFKVAFILGCKFKQFIWTMSRIVGSWSILSGAIWHITLNCDPRIDNDDRRECFGCYMLSSCM